ncbi:hypothetical protein QBC43DRAFT_293293 [Cladorrhinum sp. PSN259]|nr:hypothetical protein QBC43DRAFT_293293 [Cladorrhinum sp. PSN259]
MARPADNLTPEQQNEIRIKELKNKERAYIAASRRSDRSLEKRLKSAYEASAVHKELTGRALKITEEIVRGDQMYEEEEDERTRAAHSRQFANLYFNPQIGHSNHQHPIDEEFARAFPMNRRVSINLPAENPPYSRDFRPSFTHYHSQHRPYVAHGAPSYDIHRTRYSPVRQVQVMPTLDHPARYRRSSAGSVPLHPSPLPPLATGTYEDSASPASNTTSNSSLSASPQTEPDGPLPTTPVMPSDMRQFPPQVQGHSPVFGNQPEILNDYVMIDPQNLDLQNQQLMDAVSQFDDLDDFNFQVTMPTWDACQYPDKMPPSATESEFTDLVNWDFMPEGDATKQPAP